jgi:hypothetical protein
MQARLSTGGAGHATHLVGIAAVIPAHGSM